MIKANELRIGNLVLDSDRDNPYFHQVVRIETKEYTEWDSGNEFNIVCLLEGTKDSYFEMIPSPIPLTEEWLVRFGLLNNDLGIWNNGDAIYFDYGIERSIELNYVHQLQNIYFALTGEELKLNDK